jgi:hypothetical protein
MFAMLADRANDRDGGEGRQSGYVWRCGDSIAMPPLDLVNFGKPFLEDDKSALISIIWLRQVDMVRISTATASSIQPNW